MTDNSRDDSTPLCSFVLKGMHILANGTDVLSRFLFSTVSTDT